MKCSVLILLAAVALAAGCGPRSGRNAAPAAPAAAMRDFPTVKIPDVYSEAKDRQTYFAEHFWDRFFSESEGMLCDSVTVCGVPAQVLEQVWQTYVILIQTIGLNDAKKDVGALFDKIEAKQMADTLSNVYDVFGKLADRYLYDPNSPFRNEDIYQPYLEKMAASPLTDPDMAASYAYEAKLCSLNAVGTQAADFRFTDAAGVTRRLYDIKAVNTLLFFSNPGCSACKEIVESISQIRDISKKIKSGRLAIVCVYIDDDLNAWRSHVSEMPRNWINAYDTDRVIRRDLIYNIRGIPSLYVLDKDKRVVMKDAPEDRVFTFLDTVRAD